VRLFRVFPHDPSAADNDEGGALFVPPPSTLGRIANVDLYRELYFAEQPEAAVAETFGFLYAWYPSDFVHARGRRYAVSTYELDAPERILNLNDTAALQVVGIEQPSHVVTKDRAVSQAWARTIFDSGKHHGVSWWSYYCPDWTVCALWAFNSLRHIGPVETLTLSHPAVVAAARAIVRQIHSGAPPSRRRPRSSTSRA
jgi:hypothetical protein